MASIFLPVEKWLLIILLGLLILGYRIRFTAAISALLLAHLGLVRITLQWSGETTALFIGVYFLIFFALYAEEDELSIDGVRRTKNETLDDLRANLKSTKERSYNLSALKWSLVTIGIIYFGAGFDKIFPGPRFGFATAENLSRIIVMFHTFYDQPYDFPLLVVEYPWLMEVAAWGTLVLELGFLLTILLGVTITPIVLGIYAFQTGIALSMGILFADVYPMLALFVAWDSIYKRLVRDRTIDLVFDEHCYFCARSLYLFKLLDVNRTVDFYSQYDAPEEYKRHEDVNFEESMYVFYDGIAYEGYFAFRELLRQFRVFFPVVWLMRRSVIERIGTRVYRYIADNRSRHFKCKIEANP